MYDEAHENFETKSAVLPPNSKKRKASSNLDDTMELPTLPTSSDEASSSSSSSGNQEDSSTNDDLDELLRNLGGRSRDFIDEEDDTSDDEDPSEVQLPRKFQSSVVLPRRRFAGACNVETIKDGMLPFPVTRSSSANSMK